MVLLLTHFTEARWIPVTGPPHPVITWQTQHMSPCMYKFSTHILNCDSTMLHLFKNIADILLKQQKPTGKIITQQPILKSNHFFHLYHLGHDQLHIQFCLFTLCNIMDGIIFFLRFPLTFCQPYNSLAINLKSEWNSWLPSNVSIAKTDPLISRKPVRLIIIERTVKGTKIKWITS